jgi:hypothetical protein
MRLESGTVAYWLNFSAGHDKFVYILGTTADRIVLSFTISSQAKYLSIEPHRNELIAIPIGTLDCLHRQSFIQCFHEVTRTPLGEFQDLDRRGFVNWRGCLPQYIADVIRCVENSQLLPEDDQEVVLDLLRPRPFQASAG